MNTNSIYTSGSINASHRHSYMKRERFCVLYRSKVGGVERKRESNDGGVGGQPSELQLTWWRTDVDFHFVRFCTRAVRCIHIHSFFSPSSSSFSLFSFFSFRSGLEGKNWVKKWWRQRLYRRPSQSLILCIAYKTEHQCVILHKPVRMQENYICMNIKFVQRWIMELFYQVGFSSSLYYCTTVWIVTKLLHYRRDTPTTIFTVNKSTVIRTDDCMFFAIEITFLTSSCNRGQQFRNLQ